MIWGLRLSDMMFKKKKKKKKKNKWQVSIVSYT